MSKIQIRELMIGNIIKLTPYDINLVVTQIDESIDALSIINRAYNCDDMTPILLTEEWLLKFGFKKFGVDDYPRTLSYLLDGFSLFPSNPFCDFKGYGVIHFKPDPHKTTESAVFKIQYVHELQNLFFCHCKKTLPTND